MMDSAVLSTLSVWLPCAAMIAAALMARLPWRSDAMRWRAFMMLSAIALFGAAVAAWSGAAAQPLVWWAKATPLGLGLALLVQFLGVVISAYSARYLEGQSGQGRYAAALGAVLAAVHLLLLADHWLSLIVAWALVGMALNQLLCFYPERVFARLAAHKKQLADRLADALLVAAAALSWHAVGSGSLSALELHLAQHGASTALQWAALALVLAVILRTALLPVHGWLLQVMEAPTPVSALLHAGVVNLGGFVLIRFAPLLEQVTTARSLLVACGLVTAVLASMVMLTRVSIKVRLAWSTLAQMGFMLLECGLGLYSFAALHLIGHSLYKAHAFLSASSIVRSTRLEALRGEVAPQPVSLLIAPAITLATVEAVHALAGHGEWPWWWRLGLGLAWAPLLWLPADSTRLRAASRQMLAGTLMVAGLTASALLFHGLPLGVGDLPHHALGLFALCGMATLYGYLVALQLCPRALETWRRWSYAGFYLDEAYTRFTLRLWPTRWARGADAVH